jgi:hypothetical protein
MDFHGLPELRSANSGIGRKHARQAMQNLKRTLKTAEYVL